jgi:hypothetical protein
MTYPGAWLWQGSHSGEIACHEVRSSCVREWDAQHVACIFCMQALCCGPWGGPYLSWGYG